MDKNKKREIISRVVSNFKHEISPEQMSKGMEVEKEHAGGTGKATNLYGTNKMKLAKTAVAHLKEDPKYYTHLNSMEKKYDKE